MEDVLKRLISIAWRKSIAFCYHCYRNAPSGRCDACGSDDLMRLVPEVGCEYGIDWVVRHLVEAHLDIADTDAAFEESIRECYPESVQIAWLTLDTVTSVKQLDSVSWHMAFMEWLDSEVSDGRLITLDNGGSHFWTCEVETFVEQEEAALALATG